jgi:hypothetical protein
MDGPTQQDMDEIYDDMCKFQREDLRLAVRCAIKDRCKNQSDYFLNRLQRWFYTAKVLICVFLNRYRIVRDDSDPYPQEVEVTCHHFAKLYAGWESRSLHVGCGYFSQWWYQVENDGEWNI